MTHSLHEKKFSIVNYSSTFPFFNSLTCQKNMLRIFPKHDEIISRKCLLPHPARTHYQKTHYESLLNDVGVCFVGFSISRHLNRGWAANVVKHRTTALTSPCSLRWLIVSCYEIPASLPSKSTHICRCSESPWCHDKLKITNKQSQWL